MLRLKAWQEISAFLRKYEAQYVETPRYAAINLKADFTIRWVLGSI